MLRPRDLGFRQPAEWCRHRAVWLAWPSHAELWGESLADAQREMTGLCAAIADVGPDSLPRGEALEVMVRNEADAEAATRALAGLGARLHTALYGDIWLRDTAPIFLTDSAGRLAPTCFRFNGWGGKYELPGDAQLAGVIAGIALEGRAGKRFDMPFVLEGGAVDVDGEGTLLTTRQCLLNPNRNPRMSEAEIERALCDSLGVTHVLWLEDGLLHDHTDGHVDTLARFVAPGVVVCMAPSGDDDPNRQVLERIAKDLARMRDAHGRALEVVRIPSPGRVLDEEGEIMPASHANFYVGNTTVVVPTYGTAWDDAVIDALAPIFPSHRVVGASARVILEGGGAFHCVTQQEPESSR